MNNDLARDPQLFVANLKIALGAKKYLADPTIRGIFNKQRDQIGDMLGAIDAALPGTPRTVGGKSPRTFDKWQPQNLQTEWKTYVDKKWADAVDKYNNFMKKWPDMLQKKCNDKNAVAKDASLATACQSLTKFLQESQKGPAFN